MDRRAPEFSAFAAQATDGLLRTAYLIVGDLAEAEDLVQETLFKLSRRWPRVRRVDHPVAYARRVLVNLALDGAPRRSRHRRELGLALPDDRPDPSSTRAIDSVAAQDELLTVLRTLPPRQRAVLVLRYYLDLPEAEVAAALKCSVGTVKSTASRGLARLEQTISEPSGSLTT